MQQLCRLPVRKRVAPPCGANRLPRDESSRCLCVSVYCAGSSQVRVTRGAGFLASAAPLRGTFSRTRHQWDRLGTNSEELRACA